MNGTDTLESPASGLSANAIKNLVIGCIFAFMVCLMMFGAWLTLHMRRREREAQARSNDQPIDPAHVIEPIRMEPIVPPPAPMATSYEASRASQPPLSAVVAVMTPVPPSTPRIPRLTSLEPAG